MTTIVQSTECCYGNVPWIVTFTLLIVLAHMISCVNHCVFPHFACQICIDMACSVAICGSCEQAFGFVACDVPPSKFSLSVEHVFAVALLRIPCNSCHYGSSHSTVL